MQEAVIVYHNLYHAVLIAQIQKLYTAVIPNIFDPTRYAHILAREIFVHTITQA